MVDGRQHPAENEDRGAAQADAGHLEPPEHPEARGFGSRRRWRWELVLVAALVVSIPLVVIWGARALAEAAAMRLPPELDAKLGRPTWEALRVSGQRCEDPAAERYVAGLMQPLIEALGATPFRFELMVVDDAEVNAFALPGGYVIVNSGLLSEARSGEEVAGVLAHELSHVTERHGTRRLAGSLGVGVALGLALGLVDLGAPAYTVAELAGLRYERGHESEADARGQALLERAGISPLGMATFFERLSQAATLPELLSTHPDPGGRAAQARLAARGFQPRLSLPAPGSVACSPAK
jgi:beta-barrel assembly-enhancing protease